MGWLPDGEKNLKMFSRFDRIYERNCDDNNNGDVTKSTTGINFNYHTSKISNRNLYSK